MSDKKPKVIPKSEVPRKVTDQTDLDLIRHLKTSLAKIYAKYGLDYREELAGKFTRKST